MKKTYAQVVAGTGQPPRVQFSEDRPSTSIGAQAEHASAYDLFKKIVLAAIESLPIDDAIRMMIMIIDSYASNHETQKIVDEMKDREELQLLKESPKLKEQVIDKNLFDKFYQFSANLYLEKVLSELISRHLELRNRLEDVSFPSEWNLAPPPGEGARVKNANTFLKKLAPEAIDASLEKINEAITHLLWYPKIPEQFLYDETKHKAQWQEVRSKKYNTRAKPRTNDRTTLNLILKRHITLVFQAFPVLKSLEIEQRNKIVDSFLKSFLLAPNSTWKLKQKEFDPIHASIYQLLKEVDEENKSASKSSEDYQSTSPSGSVPSGSRESSDNEDRKLAAQMFNTTITTDDEADPDYSAPPEAALDFKIRMNARIAAKTRSQKNDKEKEDINSLRKGAKK